MQLIKKEELDKVIEEMHKDEEFLKSIEEIRKKIKILIKEENN